MKHKTREEWLQAGVAKLRHVIPSTYEVPDIRVSCGFPKNARGAHNIGQCWFTAVDGVAQVFITPELTDGSRILDVLLHEIGHAILGQDAGHKKPFKLFMNEVGLGGKATATIADDVLRRTCNKFSTELGPYPHSELMVKAAGRKQSTRLKKVECKACGYIARVTDKWINDVGAPLCPCNGEGMEVK